MTTASTTTKYPELEDAIDALRPFVTEVYALMRRRQTLGFTMDEVDGLDPALLILLQDYLFTKTLNESLERLALRSRESTLTDLEVEVSVWYVNTTVFVRVTRRGSSVD